MMTITGMTKEEIQATLLTMENQLKEIQIRIRLGNKGAERQLEQLLLRLEAFAEKIEKSQMISEQQRVELRMARRNLTKALVEYMIAG